MNLKHYLSANTWLVSANHLQALNQAALAGTAKALAGQKNHENFYSYIVGSTGVLKVSSFISESPSILQWLFGGTDLEGLSAAYERFQTDPNISRIVAYFRTPGGTVSGVDRFAQQVFAHRGNKPQIAVVGSMCCSAGYWVASAFDKIVSEPTSEVGGIGAIYQFDLGEDENTLVMRSSQSPNKYLSPETEEGKQAYQDNLDSTAQVFIDAIAKHRGISSATVTKDYGQGGTFIGQNALDAGLVDEINYLDAIISEETMSTPTEGANNTPQSSETLITPTAQNGPIMATHAVAEIIEASEKAKVSMMLPQLLAPGVTKDQALSTIATATAIQGQCEAAGFNDADTSLVLGSMGNVAEMLGKAIQIAKADSAPNIQSNHGTISQEPQPTLSAMDVDSIYQKRKA